MNRLDYTQHIINEAGLDICLHQALKDWWYPNLRPAILRLKLPGLREFKRIAPSYEFRSTLELTGATYKLLNKLPTPYFIERKPGYVIDISIFSTKTVTIINLYGSIEKYLNTLE